MSQHQTLATAFLLAAVHASGTAQATWNVSPPGSNLLAAVAAAEPGDTIVLAPGTYDVVFLSAQKPLTLIGTPGAVVEMRALIISDLPAGSRFLIHGLQFEVPAAQLPAPPVLFTEVAGHVHISQCTFRNHDNATLGFNAQLTFVAVDLVTLSDCSIDNLGISLRDSHAQLTRCVVRGRDAVATSNGGQQAITALAVSNGVGLAQVTVSACSLTGGSGRAAWSGAPALGIAPNVAIRVAGDASHGLFAGAPGPSAQRSVSARYSNVDSDLWMAAPVQVVPNAGAPPIDGPFRSTPNPVAVATGSAALGGQAQTTVWTDPGDSVWLFLGIPALPRNLPGLGVVHIGPAPIVLLGATTIDASGSWTLATSIPADPSLRFQPLTTQAIASGTFTPLRLSTPSTFVIE